VNLSEILTTDKTQCKETGDTQPIFWTKLLFRNPSPDANMQVFDMEKKIG